MKQSIGFSQFCDAFARFGRNEQFSYAGKRAIFEHLESIEDDTGEEIELDVIAICCDFAEEHWEDIANDYNIDLSDCDNEDEKEAAVMAYLQENTCVVGNTSDGIVYVQF